MGIFYWGPQIGSLEEIVNVTGDKVTSTFFVGVCSSYSSVFRNFMVFHTKTGTTVTLQQNVQFLKKLDLID